MLRLPVIAKTLLIFLMVLCSMQSFCQTTQKVDSSTLTDISTDIKMEAIVRVVNAGIMQGYPGNVFKPKQNVPEKDFNLIVSRILEVCPGVEKPEMSTDQPSLPVTRLRAIAIIVRAYANKNAVDNAGDPDAILKSHSDYSDIPVWGKKYIAYAISNYYIENDTKLRPNEPITRSELAGMLAVCLPTASPVASATSLVASPSVSQAEFTGLVVDSCGTGLTRAMFTIIKAEDGTQVYPDPKNLPNIDVMEDQGMAGFVNDINKATRCGERPFIIKAIRAEGSGKCTAIISNSDKDRLLEAEKTSKFLRDWKVVFVIDAKKKLPIEEPAVQPDETSTSEPEAGNAP